METNILDLLNGKVEDTSSIPTGGNILDLLKTGFRLPDPKPAKPRIFTERLFNVIGYKLNSDETRTIENVGQIKASRLKKALKKQGFYRVDVIEVSGKAHGEELIFTEKNYIEKNASKFTPGNPQISDHRLAGQRAVAHQKLIANMAKKNNSVETRSDTDQIQIWSKESGNLIFKGEEADAVTFMISKQIKVNEHVFYVNGKIYGSLKRMEEANY